MANVAQLRELFYPVVGDARDPNSLPSFLQTALQDFSKYSKEGIPKRLQYVQDESRVVVTVFYDSNGPNISALLLGGKEENLVDLLSKFKGTLEAKYSGEESQLVTLQTLPDLYQQRIRRGGKKKNKGWIGDVALQLHPLKEDTIISATLQKQRGYRPFHRYETIPVEEATLDDAVLAVLGAAQQIMIQHSFYVGNDENNASISEKSMILQLVPNSTASNTPEYWWTYTIKNLSGEGLPGEKLKDLENIFSVLKDRFRYTIFARGLVAEE